MTPLRLAPVPVQAPAAGASGRSWLPWLLVTAMWGGVAAMDATQVRFYFESSEPHHGWAQAFIRTMPFWLLWIASTPLVVYMARRFPLERGTLPRRIPLHLGVAALLGVAHGPLAAGAATALWTAEYGYTFGHMLTKYVIGRLHIQLVIYAAITGIVHALESQRRLGERDVAASELQARLAEAQLHALQSQIHPHFLFNTLNAVSVLVLKGESRCAVRMISRLSDLLRATLERSAGQETTLADEMDLLGRYLDIERVRFGDRLTIDVDVPPAAMEAMVPTLVLQPLVENAVRHGIAETPGPGRIVIQARTGDGRLLLEVRDTGPGLPRGGVIREGIGLANTRARLAGLYGDDGRLELSPARGGGTVAAVELPFRRAPLSARPALAESAA